MDHHAAAKRSMHQPTDSPPRAGTHPCRARQSPHTLPWHEWPHPHASTCRAPRPATQGGCAARGAAVVHGGAGSSPGRRPRHHHRGPVRPRPGSHCPGAPTAPGPALVVRACVCRWCRGRGRGGGGEAGWSLLSCVRGRARGWGECAERRQAGLASCLACSACSKQRAEACAGRPGVHMVRTLCAVRHPAGAGAWGAHGPARPRREQWPLGRHAGPAKPCRFAVAVAAACRSPTKAAPPPPRPGCRRPLRTRALPPPQAGPACRALWPRGAGGWQPALQPARAAPGGCAGVAGRAAARQAGAHAPGA